jgi:hypothetical protein
LFHKICRPLATKDTQGAFLFGYRLMAVDGTVEDVPDTPENKAAFKRQVGSRGASAFPQLRNVHLVETGTHAICDSVIRGYQYGERSAALRLLRSVDEGMLLMWDRGFHSYEMVKKTLRKGAQFLGRVPANTIFKPIKILPDGSFISEIFSDSKDRSSGLNGIKVRIVEYTIDDPGREGHRETHRLITSLLDHKVAPAKKLALEYHQRWEIEITFDEIDTHQRVRREPLRSQKPVGVIQEMYGMLIAHYLVRFFMHEAALKSQKKPTRLSFIGTLRIIRRKIILFQIAEPEKQVKMYNAMLREISKKELPPRSNRSNSRVIKKKMSKFMMKRAVHRKKNTSQKTMEEAIILLNPINRRGCYKGEKVVNSISKECRCYDAVNSSLHKYSEKTINHF